MIRHYKEKECVTEFIDNNTAKSRKNVLEYSRFSQYTNIDSLFAIIKGQKLKFSRLDLVNDLIEQKQFEDEKFRNLIYACCFTHRVSEFIPHWIMYTKLGYGVRITFEVEDKNCLDEIIINKSIPFEAFRIDSTKTNLFTMKDLHCEIQTGVVFYQNDFYEKNKFPGGINFSAAGLGKKEDWKFEDETRMRLLLRLWRDTDLDLDFEYVLVPIQFNKLKSFTITFSPWMEETVKESIKDYCNKEVEKIGIKINYKNSSLEKAVKLK